MIDAADLLEESSWLHRLEHQSNQFRWYRLYGEYEHRVLDQLRISELVVLLMILKKLN